MVASDVKKWSFKKTINPDEHANFFAELPALNDIYEITNAENYTPAPPNWHVVITDVRGSTDKIKAGKYKDVNAVAAASITALLNITRDVELPFVFGGDGAAILIPPALVEKSHEALRASRHMAREFFDIDLRIGIVPIADIVKLGLKIRVTKLFMSDNFQQAIFSGGGVARAEDLVKGDTTGHYAIPDDGTDANYEADFTGFECRWSEVPAQHEETISIMVKAVGESSETNNSIYRYVLERIFHIYGDARTRHPFDLEGMTVSLNLTDYRVETAIRRATKSVIERLKLMLYAFAGFILWKYRARIWDRYKQVVLAATDHEKFDDVLRMVISGTVKQRQQLHMELDHLKQHNLIVYGTHISSHALMTCVVFDRFGRQMHFVDGSQGGYAMAARVMKDQLASFIPPQDVT